MPSMEAKLAWALPVKADVLGAHFEAYVETLPLLNMLRLCNRFGTGSKAAVTKLPIELVQRIEDYILSERYDSIAIEWAKDLSHCERTCESADHFSHDEMLDIWCELCSDDVSLDEDGEFETPSLKRLREFVNDAECFDEVWERCLNARNDWSDRMTIFSREVSTLRQHFGLELWTSTVRLYPVTFDFDPEDTTVTYLTLPDGTAYSKKRGYCDSERNCDMPQVESGYGTPVEIDSAPDRHSLKRFQRALNILQLKVFEHPSQAGPMLSLNTTKMAQQNGPVTTTKSWPRPMMLMKSST